MFFCRWTKSTVFVCAESWHRTLCPRLWYFAVRRKHATDSAAENPRWEIPSAVLHVHWSAGIFSRVKFV